MPDGQLDVLTANQVRDLIAYLMTPRQVPLPEEPKPQAAAPRPNVLAPLHRRPERLDRLPEGAPAGPDAPHGPAGSRVGRCLPTPTARRPVQPLAHQLLDRTASLDHGRLRAQRLVPHRAGLARRGHPAAALCRARLPDLDDRQGLPRCLPATGGRKDGTEFTVWGYPGRNASRPPKRFNTMPGLPAMDWGIFPERDEDQADWKVADWAIEQLQAAATEREQKSEDGQQPAPFFLSAGFRHPHVPCYASQRWFDLYPPESLILPPVLASDRDDTPPFSWYLHWQLPNPGSSRCSEAVQWEPLVRAYLASTSFVDSQVGRVLDALEASGQAANTIVVLLSDHGWHLGEKGISGKNTLWDRSTRVPLIIAGPGVNAGGVCHAARRAARHLPHARRPLRPARAARARGPQPRAATSRRHRPAPWPALTTHGPNNHAVRTERFRYIRYADGSEELYDMVADPNEWTNLAERPRARRNQAGTRPLAPRPKRRAAPRRHRPPARDPRRRPLLGGQADRARGPDPRHRHPRRLMGVRTEAQTVSAGRQVREGGFEPPPSGSKPESLPLADSRVETRAPCGSRTRVSALGEQCLAARPRTQQQIQVG